MLIASYTDALLEGGCDEAGRGCLAGPVVAAVVIFPKNFTDPMLDDSKKLTPLKRFKLRETIRENALAWAVGIASNQEIDTINILQATYLAMHRALDSLEIKPELLLVDGNRFEPYPNLSHICIVKGDSKYLNIAAASIMAKTYRDELMLKLHHEYPVYKWNKNKGYPTQEHICAIIESGRSPYHRNSFRIHKQLRMKF